MKTEFERKLAHELPVQRQDIVYQIVDTIDHRPKSMSIKDYRSAYKESIPTARYEVSARYGAEFYENSEIQDQNKIHYYLFGLIDPTQINDQLIIQLKTAKRSPNNRINLAMIFPLSEQEKAGEIIKRLDNELGINTIYQDTIIELSGVQYLTVSATDIADNMACETFRVKYQTIHKTDGRSLSKLAQARREVWDDVKRMQSIYEMFELWHRSPYDGAFMFLTKYGWLTTATRTLKNNVTKKDLSLILDFDEATETITYAGDRLPSSDLPEFLVLIKRNEEALAEEGENVPIIRYMAHFHKNEITRNPEFIKYAVPFYRYGVSESGHKFADELLKQGKATDGINIHGKGRGFIILEHGVVRIGVKLPHLEDFLANFRIRK